MKDINGSQYDAEKPSVSGIPKPYYPKSVNDALKKNNESIGRIPAPEPGLPDLIESAPPQKDFAAPFDGGSQEKQAAQGPSPARRERGRKTPFHLMPVLFFPGALLFQELLLRAFDSKYTRFFDLSLLRVILFSIAAGLFVHLILDLIPKKNISRIVGVILMILFIVLLCIERGLRRFFGNYFGMTTIGGMGGDVAGGFKSETVSTIIHILPFIFLSLIPLAALILFRRRVISKRGDTWALRAVLLAIAVVLQLIGWGLSAFGGTKAAYTYEFSFTNAIPKFGLFTSARLELKYTAFGFPEEDLSGYIEDPPDDIEPPDDSDKPDNPDGPDNPNNPDGPDNPENPDNPNNPDDPPTPVEYDYNILDLDFDALAEGTSDKELKSMHKYFGSLTPSKQNEYTGMFKGKNLIYITAESFSTYAMSEELTPTLWKLSHEGFVFNNYFQPDWTMSTAGGEFANMTGIIPNWVGGQMTIYAVRGNSMPMTLGSMLTDAGYNVNAFHNHYYTFYKRNLLYPTLGYDHFNTYDGGTEGGINWPEDEVGDWPKSDLTMMEVTVDDYINEYLSTGVPFHTYYMTVSAHAAYNWNNDMARKNKEAVQAAYPDFPDKIQAYIACNLELEAAMKYLVEKLEAAGIADDTLIVLSTDHYPYKLLEEEHDYYSELRGFTDTEKDTSRFKTTLIMWSGSIEEPVTVDTPCYSCDIVPTIANLFGLSYDSRLYTGRDIFATNYEVDEYSSCMPLVIFANNKGQGNSWITAAGTYEAATKTFTPNEGVTVPDDYVKRVKNLVSGKIKYAKLIVSEDYYSHVFD